MQIEVDPQELLEEVADMQHQIWAHWMTYLFSRCPAVDGQVLIPASLVERWLRQINTPYSELTEIEKESDRQVAAEALSVVYGHRATVRENNG
jgi:hypothetical protein